MEGGGDEARRRIDEIKFRNQGGNMEGIAGFNLEYNDDVPDPAEQDDVVVNRRRLESMDDMASLSPSRKHKGGSVVRNETYSFEAFIDPKQVAAAQGPVKFRHTTARAELRSAGKLPGRNIIEQAHQRMDGKALRAKDGAVLKTPYVVRLKGR